MGLIQEKKVVNIILKSNFTLEKKFDILSSTQKYFLIDRLYDKM